MTNRFLVTAATVALIAGTGFANAQGAGTDRGAAGGSTAQQSAPATSAPMNRSESSESGGGASKAAQSDEKGMSREGGKSQRAQDNMKGDHDKSQRAQDNMKGDHDKSQRAQDNMKGDHDKSQRAQDNMKGDHDKSQSAQDNDRSKSDKGMKAEGRDRDSNTAEKSSRSTTTTGQAGASAKLSTEQRTKITTVIKNEHIRPETNVNFSVSIGTRVPREVHFHPLPTEIITVYPDWRGYEFFLVSDQIIVVNPRTLEIVAVLDA